VCAAQGRGSPAEVENRTSSPAGKHGQIKSRVDAFAGDNQFQVLRDLLGDYPSSDNNSVGGDTVIPESVFEGVEGDEALRYHCVTKNDCIVYSRRRERGKGKVINEVGSCSSGLLGFGGVSTEADEPMVQDEGEGLNGIDPPLGQTPGMDEGSAV